MSKAAEKLTKGRVEGYAPRDGKPYDLFWCTDPVGFGVRVTDKGKRSYFVQGRVNGKEVRYTIGAHGAFTVEKARDMAKELLVNMRKGINPQLAKRQKKAADLTLKAVADAYVRDRTLKQTSIEQIERHVKTTLAFWSDKPIASITREGVSKRFNELRTGGLNGKRAAPGQANQAFATLKALINYARDEYRKADGTPLLADNPCDVLRKKWARLEPRTSRIPDDKVGAVWTAMQGWLAAAHNRDTLSAVSLAQFLLLTGCRLLEAGSLAWDNVNLDQAWFHLPDPKNSNPVWLPLSTQAVSLLRQREAEKVKGNPFVFPSWGKSGHITDIRGIMSKVSAVAGTKITAHDLRRTYTTIGIAQCGIDLVKVELLTNHRPAGVTTRHYLETQRLQYLRPQTQAIADYIEACGQNSTAQDAP